MLKFIIKGSCFILTLSLIIIFILFINPDNKDAFMYEHHNHMTRLDTLSSPKMILVGGSNLGFSTNSEMIQDSLKINIQNTGLHAAMGLRYMVDVADKYAKEGDIVIIKPEYQQFTGNYNGSTQILASAYVYAPHKIWNKLNLQQMLNIISNLPQHIWDNYNFKKIEGWQYSAQNFNIYGDEVAHWKEKRSKNIPTGIIKNEIDITAIRDLRLKIKRLEHKGCKVYLLWPNTIESNYEINKEKIHEIEEAMNQYGLNFLSSPEKFVFPDSLAFDTPYHLTQEGAEKASLRMIEVLKDSI